jgi:predicted AlkP superfamily pyrophosphatase or phosphodiesterase
MPELPDWVAAFNATVADTYIDTWNTLLPIEDYIESGLDNTPFEGPFSGEETPTFPHHLKELMKENGGFDLIKRSPYGNSITADFAMAAIQGEGLGTDEVTDFLAVSFSSTDYIGHQFGVNSVEIEDTYIRLDRDLERLFAYLDTKVGEGSYTVFLTADHGAVHVPNYLKKQNIPSGYFNKKAFAEKLNAALLAQYKTDKLIKNISNNQVFLDRGIVLAMNEDLKAVQDFIAHEILNYKHVDKVFTATTLMTSDFNDGIAALLQNGFHPKHSGDVVFALAPAVISYPETGSTHGSGLSYDTHVPMLFYGAGIKTGSSYKKVDITAIAPTISSLLGIEFPNGCSGQPIEEVLY